MNRAPSKESEEEEILPLGEESRLRGESPGEPILRGVASSPNVGVEPKSTALPQEGQKRVPWGTSLVQAGQTIVGGSVPCRRCGKVQSVQEPSRQFNCAVPRT